MAPSPGSDRRELQAFRFRLRHDHLLRQRLKHAKQEATLALARELGFALSLEDLRPSHCAGKSSFLPRQVP